MNTRKDRLLQVYEHLHAHFNIHNRTDFADALAIRRAGLYSAMNGNESYLTDSLFKKICAAFQGIFNLDYLLTGKGSLLASDHAREDVQEEHDQQPTPQPSIDPSSLVNAIIASHAEALSAKDETIAALQRELKTKDDVISDLRTRLHSLEASLTLLRHQSPSPSSPDLSRYPFPVGAADAEPAHPSAVSPQK